MTPFDNVIFALGPNESYFFNCPQGRFTNNLPDEMAARFRKDEVADVAVLALGPRTDSYFMRYKHKGGERYNSVLWADNLPSDLLSWLIDDAGRFRRSRETVQVVLGPDDSFFAWDDNSIRWSNIPKGLEQMIQEWLSPSAGWTVGPPKIVALGKGGAYLAISEHRSWGYSAPKSICSVMESAFESLATLDLMSGVLKAFMNPAVLDSWIIVRGDTLVHGHNTISREGYMQAVRSLASPEALALYEMVEQKQEETSRQQRHREEQEQERKAEQERQRKSEQERRQRERQRKHREEQEARERAQTATERLRLAYKEWHTKCLRLFEGQAPITVFPHLPAQHCDCAEPLCLTRKHNHLLKACRHDVEKLLRASGLYSVAWLRTERLFWHPDRFLRKCSAESREEMLKKATEMYTIFEELIANALPRGS